MKKKGIELTLSKLAALILALIVLIFVIIVIAKYGKFFIDKIKNILNII